ncbi:glycosyl hydrolase family 3 C-terminal domain-containing protein [Aspergillus cavernicola]|uniref:beta-glucosidase n=1 Tax=Aspergillus cavernicola TaxID=176166 RepID=A0ABR4IDM1_9EURO
MPGPTRWRKVEEVVEAIDDGKINVDTIDQGASRVLSFLQEHGRFEEDPTISKEKAVNSPQHQALIREAGAKGIALLKNTDAVLPLTKEKARGKTIALIGYVRDSLMHGGGSAAVNPHYRVTPWDALSKAYENHDVRFLFSKGAHTFRLLPLMSENILDLDGLPGFTLRIYDRERAEAIKVKGGHRVSEVSLLGGSPHDGKNVELVGIFTVPESATYYFTLSGHGPSELTIDGKVIFRQTGNCPDSMGFLFGGIPAPLIEFAVEGGKKYTIEIKSSPPILDDDDNFGFLKHRPVDIAKRADYSIVFTGHDPSWETEGQDQVSFNLPKEGSQDRLVAAVASVNNKTIVVNCTGVAVALPWLDQIQALLQAWFPGQEVGNAIADVLTGVQNPEGHLTCSFPKRLEDCPAYLNFPGDFNDGQPRVKYEEGFSDMEVTEPSADVYTVTVSIQNTGHVKGATAVQAYVGKARITPENPIKALLSFKKVNLESDESVKVELPVSGRDFASWDTKTQKWIIEEGEYSFSVGKSAGHLVLTTFVHVNSRTYDP